MTLRFICLGIIALVIMSCQPTQLSVDSEGTYPDVKIVGAMKNVMWKGELDGIIDLDTLSDRAGLYGLGPESYLTGELLIVDGKSYVSRVSSDSTMEVERSFDVSAPFFVYANVVEWTEIELTPDLKTIQDLQRFIDAETKNIKRPFAFKLSGQIEYALIHVQNLPEGTDVSSPDQAHQGQVNFELNNEAVVIVGFFSMEHQGVFTHHDSYLHMHLLTKDKGQMGHLDELVVEKMNLYLPKK